MTKTAKLADVAKAAGVSQGTVSNVFNRPDLVSDELREKVEAAARSLGYRGPDPRGRLLRAGRVNAIGVVVTSNLASFFLDPYERRFLAGVARGCDEQGAGLALVSALNDESAAWNIRTALVDGFILDCMMEGSRLVDLAARRGLPFVAVDFAEESGLDVVRIDDRRGARLAAEHLIDLGHREFAVAALEFDADDRTGFVDEARVAAARYGVSRNRMRGYTDALAAAGLPPPPVYETFNDEATSAEAVDALLARNPGATAFLCMSDVIACAVVRRLGALGRKVPEEVSVIGFDDTDEAGRLDPPLTTIRQPIEEKGGAAVRMILDPRAPGARPRAVELPLELVVRATTAPPRA
jgi:DNA-binding LacI/PurR family transcriptional regulator